MLPSWSASSLAAHSCANKSHIHISTDERDELLRNGLADLYCRDCGAPLQLCPCKRRNRFTIVRLRRVVALHGFSCRFGEYQALIRNTGIGRVMIAAIAMRPVEEERIGG